MLTPLLLQESHMHTLLNLVLASELPVIMEQMPPLDYFSSITFGACRCGLSLPCTY